MTYQSCIVTMDLDQLVALYSPGLFALGDMLELPMSELLGHCIQLADSVSAWSFDDPQGHAEYVLEDCTTEFVRYLIKRNELPYDSETVIASTIRQTARGIVKLLPVKAVQLEFLHTNTRGPQRLFYVRARIDTRQIYGNHHGGAPNHGSQAIL